MPDTTDNHLIIKIQIGGFVFAEEVVPNDPKAAAETARTIAGFAFKELRKLNRAPEERD